MKLIYILNRWQAGGDWPKKPIPVSRSTSIQVQFNFAIITSAGTSEKFIFAFRTDIAGFLILDPLFRSNLPPVGYCSQNDLFADGHWKVVYVLAGKVIAFVTSCITFLLRAIPDVALPAVHE